MVGAGRERWLSEGARVSLWKCGRAAGMGRGVIRWAAVGAARGCARGELRAESCERRSLKRLLPGKGSAPSQHHRKQLATRSGAEGKLASFVDCVVLTWRVMPFGPLVFTGWLLGVSL